MGNHLEPNGIDGGETRAGKGPGRVLVLRVGERRYALPVDAVLAVSEGGAATARHRGREVPVSDAEALGLGGRTGGSRGAVVVLALEGSERALRVDAVEGIVDGVEVRGWPALLAPFVGPGLEGVGSWQGGELIMLDAAALFREPGAQGERSPHEEAGETS